MKYKQYNTIQYNTIQYNTIQYISNTNTIQYDTNSIDAPFPKCSERLQRNLNTNFYVRVHLKIQIMEKLVKGTNKFCKLSWTHYRWRLSNINW